MGKASDEGARLRAEVAAMDAGLAQLSEGEWAEHLEALRPTLGAAMVRMLEGGRRAWEIRSVRGLVWERVKGSSIGRAVEKPSASLICGTQPTATFR